MPELAPDPYTAIENTLAQAFEEKGLPFRRAFPQQKAHMHFMIQDEGTQASLTNMLSQPDQWSGVVLYRGRLKITHEDRRSTEQINLLRYAAQRVISGLQVENVGMLYPIELTVPEIEDSNERSVSYLSYGIQGAARDYAAPTVEAIASRLQLEVRLIEKDYGDN